MNSAREAGLSTTWRGSPRPKEPRSRDSVRLVVYVTDMQRHRPIVNQVQEELWGGGPYPPRTIVEVSRLNQDDIVEVEGTFFVPIKSP